MSELPTTIYSVATGSRTPAWIGSGRRNRGFEACAVRIVDEIARRGIRLNGRGPERCGPCPKCGGTISAEARAIHRRPIDADTEVLPARVSMLRNYQSDIIDDFDRLVSRRVVRTGHRPHRQRQDCHRIRTRVVGRRGQAAHPGARSSQRDHRPDDRQAARQPARRGDGGLPWRVWVALLARVRR
jgi:hypothetical protein